MKFHAIAYGTVGTRPELEAGMAGKNPALYQRMLNDLKDYVRLCDQAGFAGFGHPEHHLQIEGMEATGSPGLLSMFIGQHSERNGLHFPDLAYSSIINAEFGSHPSEYRLSQAADRLNIRGQLEWNLRPYRLPET